MDWYWRLRLALPPRPQDRVELERIAPELFDLNRIRERPSDNLPGSDRWSLEFQEEIRRWLMSDEARPRVTVREGSCPQPECPLKLSQSHCREVEDQAHADKPVVLELMTVAGGWSSKSKPFFDMCRKVHGGKGNVKDILITDPFIYYDTGEENVAGGMENFLNYLDCQNIDTWSSITIHQPPYAKGKKGETGKAWRNSIEKHANKNNYSVKFEFFQSMPGTRFHDRFYLVRHGSGLVSGLFGPSMSGVNDKSFALMGELEPITLDRLVSQIKNW